MKLYVYFFLNFYLLLTALLFVLPAFFRTREEYDIVRRVFFRRRVQLPVAFTGIVLSVLAVFFPMDGRILIGDLLPVLAALGAAFLLLMGHVRHAAVLNVRMRQEGEAVLNAVQIPAAAAAVLTALLHVFFSGTLFL